MFYGDSQEAFSLDVVDERLKGLKFAPPTAPVFCEFFFFFQSVSPGSEMRIGPQRFMQFHMQCYSTGQVYAL